MSFWLVLKNIGVVISFLKATASIIGDIAKTKQKPSKDSLIDLLDKAEALLDSGAIDIPGVDEATISEALKQIEVQIRG